MGGTGVIDRFLGTFAQYIDSGFGLLQGDVHWLAGVLIVIDVTLAALFWAFSPEEEVLARLIKKTLYVGAFAFIIGNYNNLASIIFNSFAGLGLVAGGGTISAAQLLQPGRLAQVGIDAGKPILDSISGLMGFVSFFDNFIQIVILLIAWLIVVISFFIMAIQLFVSLIEFKLTTLAGFVLVPFGLFSRTAFLAEKVLGNVFSSGVKVLVLAVIVGIGSTIFGQFTSGFNNPPTIDDALTLILAALALLGLSIFGVGIANGLVAGGPQLGTGAAIGTGLAAAGAGVAGAALAAGTMGAAGRAIGGVAGAGATAAGGMTAGFRAGGARGVARAAGTAATSPLRRATAGLRDNFEAGAGAATTGGGRPTRSGAAGASDAGAPAWANRMRRHQTVSRGASAAHQAVRSGDHPSGGSAVDLSEGSAMFRRPTVRYGITPEPETPYQRAGQIWDERIGSARVQARNWRLAFFGAFLMSGGLAGGLVWQSVRGTVTPWVVQIDKLGQAQVVSPAVADYRPTDPQIAWHLARFIEGVRRIPADPVVLRHDWLEAYRFVTDRGALALNDYARISDPFSKVGKTQISVEVASVVRASDSSFRVAWVERHYVDNALAATERWSAILTIVVQPPTDAERLRKNPLGIYVHAFNWSKELG